MMIKSLKATPTNNPPFFSSSFRVYYYFCCCCCRWRRIKKIVHYLKKKRKKKIKENNSCVYIGFWWWSLSAHSYTHILFIFFAYDFFSLIHLCQQYNYSTGCMFIFLYYYLFCYHSDFTDKKVSDWLVW